MYFLIQSCELSLHVYDYYIIECTLLLSYAHVCDYDKVYYAHYYGHDVEYSAYDFDSDAYY